MEEYDTENADEQDQSAPCHLKNWNGCIEEADIHQLDEIKLEWMGGEQANWETNGSTFQPRRGAVKQTCFEDRDPNLFDCGRSIDMISTMGAQVCDVLVDRKYWSVDPPTNDQERLL